MTTPVKGSIKVTIPEGKKVVEMAAIYEKAGVCKGEDFLKACDARFYDYSFLATISPDTGLEGFLFPDTYYFNENTAPERVVAAMLAILSAVSIGQSMKSERLN